MGQEFGIVGLGVMGQSLALNFARNEISVAGYTRQWDDTRRFVEERATGLDVQGCESLGELVDALERPRRILLMVPAGDPVDSTLDDLLPRLEDGDVVVDGGNSHFRDTRRRVEVAGEAGVLFVGMGVSGGERGALRGPSMMPGGDERAWEILEPTLRQVAARTDSGPCVAHCGEGGAGHFVKMVHNGIEYGIMQIISEAYDLLRGGLGLEHEELRAVFREWNAGELESYLVEITSQIVARPDDREEEGFLLDAIEDRAEQKGTGRWTTQEALDLGMPTPTIAVAVGSRYLSALAGERRQASNGLNAPDTRFVGDRDQVVDDLRAAVYCSAICSYAQGFAVIRAGSAEYGFGTRLEEVARIWKGGCIIRARLLDLILEAFRDQEDLSNLLLAPEFRRILNGRAGAWRRSVALAVDLGIAVPGISGSLAYFDAYRRERLPANLLMAMRDFFGSHGYGRVDREGTFHSDWPPVD